jgi:ATP-binding cassette subfamily B protein
VVVVVGGWWVGVGVGVALLQDGTIVATGTHHELMQTVPAYRAVLSQDADPRGEETELSA